MGANRITQGLLTQRTLFNLQNQLRRLSVFQERLATGKRVNRPSDDPLDARQAVKVQTLIGKNEQFLSNIQAVTPQLAESDGILQRVVSIIHRTRELAVRGSNGGINQGQLDSIALEVDQLLESLLISGNHESNGRFIFAGTRTLAPPFEATRTGTEITSVAYVGNAIRIEVSIAELANVAVNEPGSVAFQGVVDIFEVLIGLRDDLRAGDQGNISNTRLADLDTSLDQILGSLARIGSIQNRIERVSDRTEDYLIQLQLLLSQKVDADFSDTIVNFNAESNAFQAALNAAGRVLQPSLLDFIR